MKEIRIVCTCSQISIPDLGLSLERGSEIFLPENEASNSQDLAHARQVGGVVIQTVERFQEERPANKSGPVVVPVPIASSVPTTIVPVFSSGGPDSRDVLRKMEEVTSAKLAEQEAFLRQELGAMGAQLLQVVRETLSGVSVIRASESAQASFSSSDVPVFIPSKIIDEEAETEINVDRAESQASSVEDAVQALKKTRGKKK